MKVVLIAAGALVVAAAVWASVASEIGALVDGAGWWALLAVAFPLFVGFAVWRGWGDY